MKRLVVWVVPPNLIACLIVGVLNLLNLTLARNNPMPFGETVIMAYALVLFTVALELAMVGVVHLVEWLDDWSRE